MCVAIYKPKDKKITLEVLKKCWDKNDDGAGMAFIKDGRMELVKGLMSWKHFKKMWEKFGVDDTDAIIHFRIATHGGVCKDNTHPFKVGNMAMMHNGVINIETLKGKTDSETFARLVVERLMENGDESILHRQEVKYLIEATIGTSKLLFLKPDGGSIIFNESKGVWRDGIWFSNANHESYQTKNSYSTGHYDHVLKEYIYGDNTIRHGSGFVTVAEYRRIKGLPPEGTKAAAPLEDNSLEFPLPEKKTNLLVGNNGALIGDLSDDCSDGDCGDGHSLDELFETGDSTSIRKMSDTQLWEEWSKIEEEWGDINTLEAAAEEEGTFIQDYCYFSNIKDELERRQIFPEQAEYTIQ